MMSAKPEVTELEKRIHETEGNMKNASGNELKQLMDLYTNLFEHSYEPADGYSYHSEALRRHPLRDLASLKMISPAAYRHYQAVRNASRARCDPVKKT